QRSPKSYPDSAAILGNKLVGVIPGSVFTSRTYSFSPLVTRRSTRTAPVVPSARAARRARFCTPERRAGGRRAARTPPPARGTLPSGLPERVDDLLAIEGLLDEVG